jgi:hypothetical protein
MLQQLVAQLRLKNQETSVSKSSAPVPNIKLVPAPARESGFAVSGSKY